MKTFFAINTNEVFFDISMKKIYVFLAITHCHDPRNLARSYGE